MRMHRDSSRWNLRSVSSTVLSMCQRLLSERSRMWRLGRLCLQPTSGRHDDERFAARSGSLPQSRKDNNAMGIIVLLLLMRLDSPQEWPSFRGPGATGVADGQRLPDAWDGAKEIQIKWKTEIPGLAHSSPIVWGDQIFVT